MTTQTPTRSVIVLSATGGVPDEFRGPLSFLDCLATGAMIHDPAAILRIQRDVETYRLAIPLIVVELSAKMHDFEKLDTTKLPAWEVFGVPMVGLEMEPGLYGMVPAYGELRCVEVAREFTAAERWREAALELHPAAGRYQECLGEVEALTPAELYELARDFSLDGVWGNYATERGRQIALARAAMFSDRLEVMGSAARRVYANRGNEGAR